jgi:hypothetical protein
MTKKKFRDWVNEDYIYEEEPRDKFAKKDSKRYDKKKARIQNARKNKNKMKNSYFDG